MGFKIESIAKAKNDAEYLKDYSQKVIAESNDIKNALEELNQVVSGGGIEGVVSKLSEALDSYIRYLSDRQNRISQFIDKQMLDYSNATSSSSANLKKAVATSAANSNEGGV